MLGLGFGINKRSAAALGSAIVLEQFGTPAAAYSLRYIYPTIYSGDVVLVRRSSDNAEEGFTPDEILNGTLVAFTGAGDGFVKTWYDQSGNGFDATQATAGTQPIIVNSGALVTVGGLPAIHGTSSRRLACTITNLNAATNLSSFIAASPDNVAASDSATATLFSYASGGQGPDKGISLSPTTGIISGEKFLFFFSNGVGITTGRLASTTYANTSGEQIVFSTFNLSTGSAFYKNGAAITINLTNGISAASDVSPSATTSSSDLLTLFAGYANAQSPNKYQEMIFFMEDKTADRVGLEANIADYYGITLT